EVPSLPPDPTENVDWHEDRRRQTSLTVEDLGDWYVKVVKLSNDVKRDYWLAVLFTGGRRTQMAESQWKHIDLEAGTWHFPRPKGGTERAYTIPLSRFVTELLKTRKEANAALRADSPWVFPSEEAECGCLQKPRNDKQGLPMAHALRHTYRTHGLIAG